MADIRGLLEGGNVDLKKRPRVKNADGSISTVRSMSFNEDGREVLIPTVHDDGYIMSNDDAVKHYRASGRHLGKFDTPDNATSYAKQLSADQDREYNPPPLARPTTRLKDMK